jgi:hypothetical protein
MELRLGMEAPPGRQGSHLRGVALAGHRTSVWAPLSPFRANHRARGTPWPGTLETAAMRGVPRRPFEVTHRSRSIALRTQAGAGMALCYFIVMSPFAVWGLIAIRRHWERGPREDILDDLLGLLDDLAEPSVRNDLDRRSTWMSRLEHAAATMEKRLPASLNPYDKATTNWTSERASGAATALRQLKRQIAAPADGSWDRLAATLRNEVVALATGDLGKLRWAAPPSPETIRRSHWKTAIGVLRTLALAAAPLAAVIAIQPLLHLDAQPLRWAKLIGLGWALLYLLLAADPTLREKIETAQSVSNLLSSARRDSRPERRDTPEGGGGRAV